LRRGDGSGVDVVHRGVCDGEDEQEATDEQYDPLTMRVARRARTASTWEDALGG
jgi:hypothetical protein